MKTIIEKIKKFLVKKTKKVVKTISTKEFWIFETLFFLGFKFLDFHYPNYLSMFEIALITYMSWIFFLFVGLYILSDMQYHRKTYYELFLSSYSKHWYFHITEVLQLLIALILKKRKILIR